MTETKTCLVCGKAFEVPVHKKGRHAVYCSNSCRCKAARLGIKAPTQRSTGSLRRVCPICGSGFTAARRSRKYCSVSCAAIGREESNKNRQTMFRQRLFGTQRMLPGNTKRPVSYKEICRANRRRGLQDGWRGTPVMGGGSKALSLVPSA